MVLREMTPNYHPTERTFVAADVVGVGIGEWVLTVSGSTARHAFGKEELAVDAAIVGIIDRVEM